MANARPKVQERLVRVVAVPVTLEGNLSLPEKARGVVLFAHMAAEAAGTARVTAT
jgi:hypothetical protein